MFSILLLSNELLRRSGSTEVAMPQRRLYLLAVAALAHT